MIFSRGKIRKHRNFLFGDSMLDVTYEYVYLGDNFNYNTSFMRSHSMGTDRWHFLRVCKYCMRGSPRVSFGSLEVLPVGYMLPLSAILRFHKIGYHVYADDIQIYVSFKCDDPSQALDKSNVCISDIRRWMILNKLKMNDAKTEFIVFRSPLLKHDLSDLSVNVGGNLIKPSVKVRDLGVILDQTLSFDDHISAICQSAHFHIMNIDQKFIIVRCLRDPNSCVNW